MTTRKTIIAALDKHGQLTYDDIERITGISRYDARISINDAKKAQHLVMIRDDVTGQPSYKLTPEGKKWLANYGTIKQAQPCQTPKAVAPTANLEQRAVQNTVKQYNAKLDVQERLTAAEDKVKQLEASLAELNLTHAAAVAQNKIWEKVCAEYSITAPSELRAHFKAQEATDAELVEAIRRANEAEQKLGDMEIAASNQVKQANDQLSDAILTKLEDKDPSGFLVVTPNKPLRRFSKAHNADQIAAAAAKRSGIAEVFAIYPIKKAVRGVEWKKSA